ncbi:uncharacterized protein LOC113469303 [Diaphorina citri]|uniref:Uncharacterized protein LOC113469303 n=1 Tax=Diaphorina citri TaxID=121845 RepID=A0A3Q0J2N0_DIACI|nr:uncharacterized protein LOC113469303 [Diaphorina citri]
MNLKLFKMFHLPLLLIFLSCSVLANTNQIQINLCCNDNEFLSEQHDCVRSETQINPWSPVIYSPENAGFLAPGTIPENWAIVKNSKPNCHIDESLRGSPGEQYTLKLILNGNPPRYVNFDNIEDLRVFTSTHCKAFNARKLGSIKLQDEKTKFL